MRICAMAIVLVFSVTVLSAGGGYTFRNETLDIMHLNSETKGLNYPAYAPDIAAVGMGGLQTAAGDPYVNMLTNPAVLANPGTRFQVFGLQASFPPSTFEAAWYLGDHMDEFMEAVSLNDIMDGVDAFLTPGATMQERWNALNQIQDGLIFVVDLMEDVTGPPDDPQMHGFNVLPGFGMQYGHWGFSLYGYGQAAFVVRQSPTLDALAAVDIPDNPDNPLKATASVLQVLGILGAGILQDNRTFGEEVFPVAFYLSYMDIVGTAGYGRTVPWNVHAGANLKIINRRFSMNRIPVTDYDEIMNNAFSDLSKSVTGFTLDLGAARKLPYDIDLGLSLQNVIPIQTLSDEIDMDFVQHAMAYDRVDGKKQVDADGDTLMVRYKRPVLLNIPYELKLPFVMNLGLHRAMNAHWSAGLEWQDIFENDSRYQSTAGRFRAGTEYRQPLWKNRLTLTGRVGFGDEHVSCGLGLNIKDKVYLDNAYAWAPWIDAYAIYTQIRVEL
ncbi:hypothetical protein JW948_01180 [bacterium]|nr:hypothetical protein [bacterium]